MGIPLYWLWLLSFAPFILSMSDDQIEINPEAVDGNLILEFGKPLKLYCNTKHELVSVIWVKVTSENRTVIQGSDKRYTIGPGRLTVEKPKLVDAGEYECTVEYRTGSGTQNQSRIISVKLPAHVDNFATTSINFVEGDNMKLVCKAKGYPEPDIYWLKDDDDLQASDRIRVEADDRGFPNAVLRISNLSKEDRGYYKCVAENRADNRELGKMGAEILIRVKGKLAALWPFLGVCIEVIILCTIIIVYEKKRTKGTADDDNYQAPSKKGIDTDPESSDMRRRKQ